MMDCAQAFPKAQFVSILAIPLYTFSNQFNDTCMNIMLTLFINNRHGG